MELDVKVSGISLDCSVVCLKKMIYLEGDRGHEFFSKQLEPNRYRGISFGWAGWAIAHPVFGRVVVAAEQRRRGGQ